MDEEIKLPKWSKVNIYADTETFLNIPKGLKPWESVNSPLYNEIMIQCENIPWLLVWTFRKYKRRDNKKEYYIAGGWVKRVSLLWTNCHLDLFKDIKTIYNMRKLPVLYFHNASFDVTVMMKCWKALDPDIVVYTYAKNTNKNFLRGVIYSPRFGFKCLLGDTMLYETISIEAIGLALGKPKGKDVPYTMANIEIKEDTIYYIDVLDGKNKKFSLDIYIQYAERDVEIQKDYFEELEKKKELISSTVLESDKKKEWIKGTTQGSFAKSLANLYLWHSGYKGGIDRYFRFNIPDEQEEFYQETVKSNMGGYTTFNKYIRRYECKDNEEILVFDCNSQYPYILTTEIPFGEVLDEVPKESKYVTWYVVTFFSCHWNSEMESLMFPPISKEKIGVRFYMLKDYYEMMIRLCECDSVVHCVKYQRTTRVFKPFIERLYRLRKQFKGQMEAIGKLAPEYEVYNKQQQGCKLIMNSIYGKLCEKAHREGCFYYSKTCKYKNFLNEVAPFKCILSGSFVTFTGRLMLIEKIEKTIKAGFKVLYTDTDSVVFVCSKNNKKVNKIFGYETGELGEWKCEGRFNLFLNPGVKKKYVIIDINKVKNYKIAWSGINKQVINLFKSKLDNGCDYVVKDLEVIFNPNENIVFRRQKRTSILNNKYNEKIIYDSDFRMNPRIKNPTGECYLVDGDYVLIRYGNKGTN